VELLLSLSPADFERLAQRLLREAGFVNVTVVGKSGDGGIDGMGLYRLSLVSFPVYFQCKRYEGTVTAGVVRDFWGAMAGRGTRACSSPRARSPGKPRARPAVTAPHRWS
jgi:restriction system protein